MILRGGCGDSAVPGSRRGSVAPQVDGIDDLAEIGRGGFGVVYRVDGARVRVIAIAHASRRPGYWTDRR